MKLHIGNLARTTTDSELKDHISTYGEAASVEIVRDSAGASKGFGFVEFADDEKGRGAITALDGKELGGQALRVSEARPRKDAPRR